MAGNKGGARPGAGRKPKNIKLNMDIQRNSVEVLEQKIRLLNKLHDPQVIDKYCSVLCDMLQSKVTSERRDAVKIITDIILKTETPKEIKNTDAQVNTAEKLMNALRAERERNKIAEENEGEKDVLIDDSYAGDTEVYPDGAD